MLRCRASRTALTHLSFPTSVRNYHREPTLSAAASETAALRTSPGPSSHRIPQTSESRTHARATSTPDLNLYSNQTRVPPQLDPFSLPSVSPSLQLVRDNLIKLLGSSHPSLTEIATYYFTLPGKSLRPLMVLLFAQATNGLASGWESKSASWRNGQFGMEDLDRPLSRSGVLNDWNPRMPDWSKSFETIFELPSADATRPEEVSPHGALFSRLETVAPNPTSSNILPTQLRLAQITEMIHVASLLHDDVLDDANLRRANPSAPSTFGNKLSILAGDFLLGRASTSLARLGDGEVVEMMSCVLCNLVEGEVMQFWEAEKASSIANSSAPIEPEPILPPTTSSPKSPHWRSPDPSMWTTYLRKSYFKTASLMAKSARAAVTLGGAVPGVSGDEALKDIAYTYGRNVGIAFQLVDDLLDFSSSPDLGKPSNGADLRLGLATAPALYAWEEHAAMGPLIKRRFKGDGDVELARTLVLQSRALERTHTLAQGYVDKAVEVLRLLPESEAREALVALGTRVVNRTH